MSIPRIAKAMDYINDDLITEAINYKKTNKKNTQVKWTAIAACLCLVIGIGIFAVNQYREPLNHDMAATFELSGISYRIIHYPEDFERYGLITADGKPLFYDYGNENGKKVGRDDLGEVMGTVILSDDDGLVENTVYHFALFPDDDAICIIEFSSTNTYQLYVAED